ncbi:hypothetical protein [Actinokineospora enzanensis]|uniref:hypothetical protein n=1 Tax=Actinokineospora enzanensis TaxID=155975 RepID=UPI000399F82D|nr:hypothetical protein [Actinokineospora enzanensis]
MTARLRVVVTGSGADATARVLRDNGVEVVYLVDTDPARIARTAVQEDAAAIAAADALPAITGALADNEVRDIAVVALDEILDWAAATAGE